MKFLTSVFIVVFSIQTLAQLGSMNYQQAQDLLSQPMPPVIAESLKTAPTEYSFLNENGENSVAYPGQTQRLVLIHDIKLVFQSMSYGELSAEGDLVAFNKLNDLYDIRFDTAEQKRRQFLIQVKDENGNVTRRVTEGNRYSGILERPASLKDKMAGVDNELRNGQLLGWSREDVSGVSIEKVNGVVTPDALMQAFMKVVARNAAGSSSGFTFTNGSFGVQRITGAWLTPEGLDLAQMAQKFLHGAVSFSQAAGDYTSVDLGNTKGLLADNTELFKGNRPYTVVQHHWDEAFGYFGAARNFLDYSDEEIRAGLSKNVYKARQYKVEGLGRLFFDLFDYQQPDTRYALSGEKNMGLSVNAAKRDLAAADGDQDFTNQTFRPFLLGRQLIQDRPQGYLPYAQAYAVIAIHEWERVIAASVVHYINKRKKDLDAYATASFDFAAFAKHFSEMKGFAFAFQFNPNSALSIEDFKRLHDLMGDYPVDLASGDIGDYKNKLEQARDIIQEAYEFNPINVEKW